MRVLRLCSRLLHLGLPGNSQMQVSHLGRLLPLLCLSLACHSHLHLGLPTNSQVQVSELDSFLQLGLLLPLLRLSLACHSHMHLGLPTNSHHKQVSLLQ